MHRHQADRARRVLLVGVRPAGPIEIARKALARDIVAEVRELDARLKKITTEMSRVLGEHGTRLTELDGVGPVVASRLLGRTGHAGRFASASAFANYAGVAPVEVASAQKARHRLPRGGDRQLNLALHVIALTQVRMRASAGRAYYDRKIGEGKTHNEAMRCLKRRLADRVWRTMTADERRAGAGPGGHSGAALSSSAAGSTPNTSSSDKSLPGPASAEPTTSDPAA
jgi:transposase